MFLMMELLFCHLKFAKKCVPEWSPPTIIGSLLREHNSSNCEKKKVTRSKTLEQELICPVLKLSRVIVISISGGDKYYQSVTWEDNWTTLTLDGSPGAQLERTILITKIGQSVSETSETDTHKRDSCAENKWESLKLFDEI
ncbi:hypothetical protein Tco_1372281 [Tanacetum coccineum]